MEGLTVARHLQPYLPFPIPTEEAVLACTWTSLDHLLLPFLCCLIFLKLCQLEKTAARYPCPSSVPALPWMPGLQCPFSTIDLSSPCGSSRDCMLP